MYPPPHPYYPPPPHPYYPPPPPPRPAAGLFKTAAALTQVVGAGVLLLAGGALAITNGRLLNGAGSGIAVLGLMAAVATIVCGSLAYRGNVAALVVGALLDVCFAGLFIKVETLLGPALRMIPASEAQTAATILSLIAIGTTVTAILSFCAIPQCVGHAAWRATPMVPPPAPPYLMSMPSSYPGVPAPLPPHAAPVHTPPPMSPYLMSVPPPQPAAPAPLPPHAAPFHTPPPAPSPFAATMPATPAPDLDGPVLLTRRIR